MAATAAAMDIVRELRAENRKLREALDALLRASLVVAEHHKIDVAAEMVANPDCAFAKAVNALAIAAGTRSAETRSKAPSEGCQSGPEGIAQKDANA